MLTAALFECILPGFGEEALEEFVGPNLDLVYYGLPQVWGALGWVETLSSNAALEAFLVPISDISLDADIHVGFVDAGESFRKCVLHKLIPATVEVGEGFVGAFATRALFCGSPFA